MPFQFAVTRELPRLRSGFRLRAPASLTPANRLNFVVVSLRSVRHGSIYRNSRETQTFNRGLTRRNADYAL
jgi:hypothetical protein